MPVILIMKKRLFLALIFVSLQFSVKAQSSFAEAMALFEASSYKSLAELINLTTNPDYSHDLNPKAKIGLKNLRRVLDNTITFTNTGWLNKEQIAKIYTAFENQGMDFTASDKGSVAVIILAEYVYNYDYKYQNVGLLIYEQILLAGHNPFYTPDKNGQSMFAFAISHIAQGSYYFDNLVHHRSMNTYVESLGMSPFIWLASNPSDESLAALRHLFLYDSELNINERTDAGKTSAFDRAIALDNTVLATILIEAGINLLATCQRCAAENYLHRISLYNSLSIFQLLPPDVVERLVNQPDVTGNTPIFWALENENPDLAIAFAKAGADLQIKNNMGLSAMDIAYQNAEVNHAFIVVSTALLENKP